VQHLVAVDAGTTGVRALAVDPTGRVVDVSYRELTQSYPSPGLVEHDATEILRLVDETLSELARRLAGAGHSVAAIGITNQRETTVALDLEDGRILAPAIVWQDRRTSVMCEAMVSGGHLEFVRQATGLTLDPYFSATKMRWLLDSTALEGARRLGLCTVDTLVCWHLTGGAHGGAYATDPSNASRTLLYDLDSASWSEHLCALFGVPMSALAAIRPSCSVFGVVAPGHGEGLEGVPVAGILGDQQAALFGQRCVRPGMVKATFGTGAFLLANTGSARAPHVDGLITSVAWDLGEFGPISYALEGSAFIAGAAIQWLRDELALIGSSSEVGELASSVADANGALFVPAFTGLGSPWWDPHARGVLIGLSRGVTRAHVARAVVDALAFQGRAILDAMRGSGTELSELRVDGGAASMDLLCQELADASRLTVRRPRSVEATAIGVATIAGVCVGATTLGELESSFDEEAAFGPEDPSLIDATYERWVDAVSRSRTGPA
jgi:glycerol kinase